MMTFLQPQKTAQNKEEAMKFDRLYQRLKIDEGCKFEIYDDHLGYKTFGIGHLVKKLMKSMAGHAASLSLKSE